MVIFSSLSEIQKLESSVVTIGTFDGIHLGHKEIFSRVVSCADGLNVPSVVITFEPHPQHVVKKTWEKKILLINSQETKIELLAKLGIDYLLIIPFDHAFSKQSADNFIREVIVNSFFPVKIIIGYDHHFGHNREGNENSLEKLALKYGFEIEVVKPVSLGGGIISSSMIRQHLSLHRLDTANQFLDRQFAIRGRVIRGQGRGKTLGFPTANLAVTDHQLIPGNGVYCVTVEYDGNREKGICNIGLRPTFEDSSERSIEVHIFGGVSEDLYSTEILVEFNKFVREEIKFDSIELLKKQINTDVLTCRELTE